jgi:Protein of unknown function (DUF3108)
MTLAGFSPIVRSLLLTATFVAASAMTAPAHALEPFAADYQASYMGLSANGRMTIESQGGNQWKYTLKISNQVAQLTQTTVFEDRDGQWRPLTGTDASLLLVKKIRRNAVYDWAKGEARWSGDVKPERAGPVPLQAGDVDGLLMNLAIARDATAGKPLRYRMVDEGRAKPMSFTVAGKESIIIAGKPRQATKLVSSNGNKQMLIWVVEGLALPARILQRKDGKDDIDLKIVSVQ